MHRHGIAAKTKRKFRCTTDSNHDRPVAENVVDRQFAPEAANEVWTADITYIPTREGWLYLAAVEDLYSRKIIGWSMSERIDSRLVVDALEMAVARRLPGAGLVAHSDRGSQYASEHYQRLLAGHGIACSMSRRANCWDNAPMESFFATLKKELTHINPASNLIRGHEDLVISGGTPIVAGKGVIPCLAWGGAVECEESSDGHRVTRWTL
jgi:transposase InsO family protein